MIEKIFGQKISNIVEIILFVGTIIAFMLVYSLIPDARSYSVFDAVSHTDYTEMSQTYGWYYFDDSGNRVELELPAVIHSGSDSVVIYNDQITEKYAGSTISTMGAAAYFLEVTDGEDTIYQYRESMFPGNDQRRLKMYSEINLEENTAGKTLQFIYHMRDKEPGVYRIDNIMVGSEHATIMSELGQAMGTFASVYVLYTIAAVCVILYICMMVTGVRIKRLLYLAAFIILCCGWLNFDISFIKSRLNDYPQFSIYSLIAFGFMGLPMVHFVINIEGMEKYAELKGCVWANYLVMIIQLIMKYNGKAELIDMLPSIHIVMIITMIIVLVDLHREYIKSRLKTIRIFLICFVVLCICCFASLIVYWYGNTLITKLLVEIGVISFVMILLVSTLVNITKDIQSRTENDLYVRLAREDGLTGLKNRRCFDETIDEIYKDINKHENIAMLFFDLNFLKQTNDKYGHKAGDELIINTARVLTKCFGENTYRFGGDEFCVLLYDDEIKTEEYWFEKLDQTILESRHFISIARGYSLMKDEQGRTKIFSYWENEVDKAMYENKKAMKAL